ncbi:ecdysis triggering hormone receptor [Cochliomyia hominivorax]
MASTMTLTASAATAAAADDVVISTLVSEFNEIVTNALEVTTRVCTTYSKQAFQEAILCACQTFLVCGHRIKRPQYEFSQTTTTTTRKSTNTKKFIVFEIIFICYLLLFSYTFKTSAAASISNFRQHNNKVILVAEHKPAAVTFLNNLTLSNNTSQRLKTPSKLANSITDEQKNGVVNVNKLNQHSPHLHHGNIKQNENSLLKNNEIVITPTNIISSTSTTTASSTADADYSTSSIYPTTSFFNDTSTTSSDASSSSSPNSSSSNDTLYDESEIPEIPSYIRTTAMFFCIIIMLMGVIGNVMVPIVIVRTKDMRNSTNIFLTNLSIADLLVLLICTPTVLVELNTKPETWVLGHEMCKAVPFVELTVAHASVLTILAISFERYYAICEPLKAGYVCTKTRAILICSLAWGIAALFTSPIILIATYRLEPYYDGTLVAVCFTSAETFLSAFYFIASITLFFFIPFAILVILYTAIAYKLLRRHSAFKRPTSPNINEAVTTAAMEVVTETNSCIVPAKEIIVKLSAARRNRVNSHPHNSLRKNRKQVIFMLVAVVSSFFVCLLPFRAFTIWVIASSSEDVASLGLEGYYNVLYFCRIMLYLNSALNPILYNLMSSKFRGGFWRLFVSCCRYHKPKRKLCTRHHITNYTRRDTTVMEHSNSLRSRRPFKREATFLVNSLSTSSGTERTSNTWRSGSVSTSLTGIKKQPESHSLAAAITDMSTTAALTTMYFN